MWANFELLKFQHILVLVLAWQSGPEGLSTAPQKEKENKKEKGKGKRGDRERDREITSLSSFLMAPPQRYACQRGRPPCSHQQGALVSAL